VYFLLEKGNRQYFWPEARGLQILVSHRRPLIQQLCTAGAADTTA
jgi:hypothetical protein